MKIQRFNLKSLQRRMLKDPKYRDIHFNPPASLQVATLIKGIRIHRGFNQEAFAKKTGLKQPTVARMENGIHYPSLRTLENVLKIFDLVLVVSVRKRKS